MNNLVMIWAGLMLMLLSGVVFLITWIQKTYKMDVDFVGLLITGVVIGVVGIIFWIYGAAHGKT